MPMNADFLDAHDRHRQDAGILLKESRWANADHLYGLAAECGLKCLMQSFGMPVEADGRPEKQHDRHHIKELWKRYETYRSGHHNGASYILPTMNPFDDWHISQRYANQSNFDEIVVDQHRRGLEDIRALVSKARKEALI